MKTGFVNAKPGFHWRPTDSLVSGANRISHTRETIMHAPNVQIDSRWNLFQKFHYILSIALFMLATPCLAEQIQKPYIFSSGTQIRSSDVNVNFDVLYQKVNEIDVAVGTAIPSGIIVMWSGSSANIPAGWVLCDGNNYTPDLRDKFIAGSGNAYTQDQTGGVATQNISHTHTISSDSPGTNTTGVHTHHIDTTSITCTGDCTDGADDGSKSVGSDSHGHRLIADTSSGGDHSHTLNSHSHNGATGASDITVLDNLPPYYALAFIMKR